jgi:hypothetical protein
LEKGTAGFSKDWMARSAPQEISPLFFQALEKISPDFPSLGKTHTSHRDVVGPP